MNRNNPDTISQKYRSEVQTSGYRFIISYAEKLDGETVEVLHEHMEFEIYYVLDNRIVSRVADNELTVNRGELLLLAPGAKHHTVYEPGVEKTYFVLIFSVEAQPNLKTSQPECRLQFEEIQGRLDRVRELGHLVAPGHPDMDLILDRIRQEMLDRQTGWNDLVNSYLHHFFIHAMRGVDTDRSAVPAPSEHLNLGVEATKFMHRNYHRDIALEDAAEYLHISPRHVNRAFRQVFGSTFSKTLSLFRLNYAKKYLLATDEPIEKIAEMVGFHSSRTLFKLFNQYEHMTVSDWRQLHRKAAKK